MIYENKYGRLEVVEASEEMRVSQMLYRDSPKCSRYSIDDLEKISVISDGAVSVSFRYPDPRQGFIFRYTGPSTVVYLKVISLEWNQEYDSVKASEQLANQRSIELADVPYDIYYF